MRNLPLIKAKNIARPIFTAFSWLFSTQRFARAVTLYMALRLREETYVAPLEQ
jgi:hypothetical protein